jgi:prepilin-type N-terminal cleavage/methylation domain-containing protein
MKQNKAYTLVEILLSITIIGLLISAMVFNFSGLVNNKSLLKTKVEQYITLNRYVKYNASLNGKKTKILVETNKLKVVMEDNFTGIDTEISTLKPQLNDLNDQTYFESEDFINTNVVTIVIYLPDGSIEKYGTVGIKIEEEELWVGINEWSKPTINSTNNNQIEEDLFLDPEW